MSRSKLKDQALRDASEKIARVISLLGNKRIEARPVAPKLAFFLNEQIESLKVALKEVEKARILENSRMQSMTPDGSAMSAFERIEGRVLQMELRSRIAAELTGEDMETQFAAMLESDSNADADLAAFKSELLGLGLTHLRLETSISPCPP